MGGDSGMLRVKAISPSHHAQLFSSSCGSCSWVKPCGAWGTSSRDIQAFVLGQVGVHQFVRGDANGVGDQLDVVNGDIALPTLQCAYKGTVKSGLISHAFLRDASVYSHQTDVAGKDESKRQWGRANRS